MNKRQVVFDTARATRSLFNSILGQDRRSILFNCPSDFHYYHVSPFLLALSMDECFEITVLKWDGFCEVNIPNVRYITSKVFKVEIFKTYDWYFTTEIGGIPWWFNNILNIFFLHGIGPKVSYFANDSLAGFDVILAPGPYVESRQKDFMSDGAAIYPVGLPSLDRFFGSCDFVLPELCRFGNDRPILLYAPSWSDSSCQISMDIEIIHALVEQDICNVIFRPHPNLFKPPMCSGFDWEKSLEVIYRGRNNFIVYSGPGSSIYDVIGGVDFLMSDISSVLYEFLIFDKPIILYRKEGIGRYYDCDEYLMETERSCHVVSRFEDLASTLVRCVDSPELLSPLRMDLLRSSIFFPGESVAAMVDVFHSLKEGSPCEK